MLSTQSQCATVVGLRTTLPSLRLCQKVSTAGTHSPAASPACLALCFAVPLGASRLCCVAKYAPVVVSSFARVSKLFDDELHAPDDVISFACVTQFACKHVSVTAEVLRRISNDEATLRCPCGLPARPVRSRSGSVDAFKTNPVQTQAQEAQWHRHKLFSSRNKRTMGAGQPLFSPCPGIPSLRSERALSIQRVRTRETCKQRFYFSTKDTFVWANSICTYSSCYVAEFRICIGTSPPLRDVVPQSSHGVAVTARCTVHARN